MNETTWERYGAASGHRIALAGLDSRTTVRHRVGARRPRGDICVVWSGRADGGGAQAVSNLLLGKKAAYAGDANLRTTTRKLGIYVPNLPAYTDCTNQF
ncbi:MAG TPA: hypothetical protein VNF50_01955, partial [Acidimicrobiales bacterium]|nr:hypothetical protein [Acidimicrobiales bacterium]